MTRITPENIDSMENQITPGQMFFMFTASWFMYWGWVHRFVKGLKIDFKDKNTENDFINRIISATHGFTSLCIACYSLWTTPMDYSAPSSKLETSMIYFSVSYFIYDLVAMRVYGVSSISIESHHLCTILGFLSTIYTGYGGRFSAFALLVTEISNGPMHTRKMCDNANMRYTKFRNLMQNLYFALYIGFRSIGGAALLAIYWYNRDRILIVVGISTVYLWFQSIYTFPVMAGIFKNELKNKRKLKSVGAKKWWFKTNPLILENLELIKSKNDNKVF